MDDNVRAPLEQRLAVVSAIDTNHESKASAPAGFDTSQCILEQDGAGRLHSKPACGFQKKCWIGLSRQSEFFGIYAIDLDIDQIMKSRSSKNCAAVLAG
jgi:hypothetical protein